MLTKPSPGLFSSSALNCSRLRPAKQRWVKYALAEKPSLQYDVSG